MKVKINDPKINIDVEYLANLDIQYKGYDISIYPNINKYAVRISAFDFEQEIEFDELTNEFLDGIIEKSKKPTTLAFDIALHKLQEVGYIKKK